MKVKPGMICINGKFKEVKDCEMYFLSGGRGCGRTYMVIHKPYKRLKEQYRKIIVSDKTLKQVEHVSV